MAKLKSINEIVCDWGSERINQGKCVICDIHENGCTYRTVVRYKVGEKKMRAVVEANRVRE